MISAHGARIRDADAVIIGSYVPEGVRVIDAVAQLRPRLLAFYDIDTPVTLSRLARHEEEYLSAGQIPLFDIYFPSPADLSCVTSRTPTARDVPKRFTAPSIKASTWHQRTHRMGSRLSRHL